MASMQPHYHGHISWLFVAKSPKVAKSGLESNKQREYEKKMYLNANFGQKVDLCEIWWRF